MFNKYETKLDLEAKAKAKKMSKGEANRQFIRAMNGKAEHVYRGELPFPQWLVKPNGKSLLLWGKSCIFIL